MTEPLTPDPNDRPTPDETFTWTGDNDGSESRADDGGTTGGGSSGFGGSSGSRSSGSASSSAGSSATAILETLREAVDDLAGRASPTVREFSARAAELAASAADKAAPLAKRAGDATSEASGKIAERSRTWATEVRASMPPTDGEPGPRAATDTDGTTTNSPDVDTTPSDHAGPA
jgi:hypothetical protein